MTLVRYLNPDCIELGLTAQTKEEVLTRLAERASSCIDGISAQEVFEVLQEREELGTTAIGGGVAIPHAKVANLQQIKMVIAISPGGVPFDAVDGEPVYVIFLLLAPEDSTTDYLKVLAQISRLVKKKDMISSLKCVSDPKEVRQIIEKAQNRY